MDNPKTTPAEAEALAAVFKIVSSMENIVATARDLMKALSLIAEALGEDEGSVVQRLSWLAMRQMQEIEKCRGDLFHMTHPSRAHFQAAGLPGRQVS